MTQPPETSVIITAYNYGKYVETCINSVLNQTYRDFEIIVVDDGSTDDTPEILKRYEKYDNILCHRQNNGGQANSKNRGASLAQGKYVAFLDADDKWDPTKLEKQIPLFLNSSVGVVYSGGKYMDPDGQDIVLPTDTNPYRYPKRGKVTEHLFIDNIVPFSSSVVRRACFTEFGGFDESLKMGIDWDLWLRLSTAYEFDYVGEPLMIYRIGHPGQMSKNSDVRIKCVDRIMAKFLRYFPGSVSPEVIQEAEYYTYCNRGRYYTLTHRLQALKFYGRAIGLKPLRPQAYEGVMKLLIKIIVPRAYWDKLK